MFGIFFWVIILLCFLSYGMYYHPAGATYAGRAFGFLVMVLIILLGLHDYPFHG